MICTTLCVPLKEQELSLNPLPGEVCREQEEKKFFFTTKLIVFFVKNFHYRFSIGSRFLFYVDFGMRKMITLTPP